MFIRTGVTHFLIIEQQQQQSVFDRRAKLLHKERAAANPLVAEYDFLKEEIGYRQAFFRCDRSIVYFAKKFLC